MIKLDDYIKYFGEEPDKELLNNEKYQKELFEKYVVRNEYQSELRLKLQEQYNNGATLVGKDGLRKQLAAIDLGYFGRAYLPHYFGRESPAFHEKLDTMWTNGVLKNYDPITDKSKIEKANGSRMATAAPRGHAKSTNFTFKDTIHAIIYEYKHYAIIISDSTEQAEGFLEDIKAELEDNPNIVEDFGNLKGKSWKAGSIVTSTGIKVDALGSGKKIRGRKNKNWRPDLIVLDDIENDENVNTSDQRKKLDNWFKKAVSKAGDTYTDIMYIGTILHYDSLLSNVLKNPSYKVQKYQAIIEWAVNESLWEEWEKLYTNLFDEDHENTAKIFFEANKEEMLLGTKVLWEDKLPYYDLMVMRVSEGVASFNSELQNEPIDPDSALFNEEWFDYYEDGEFDFKSDEFIFIGANDPSLGKNKRSDTSAIINLALSMKTGYMYVVKASIEKRKPDVIIQDAIDMSAALKREYGKGFYKFGVEVVQFQYFFKEVMAQRGREAGEYLPIEEIQNVKNKELRIESLQPFIKNGFIKFNRKHKTLINQLLEYPMGKNDDAPDCLEMAVRLAIAIRAVAGKVTYKSIIHRQLKFKKGGY